MTERWAKERSIAAQWRSNPAGNLAKSKTRIALKYQVRSQQLRTGLTGTPYAASRLWRELVMKERQSCGTGQPH
jgi:hypothetical protein